MIGVKLDTLDFLVAQRSKNTFWKYKNIDRTYFFNSLT